MSKILTKAEMARVELLGGEICMLNDEIVQKALTDPQGAQQLQEKRKQLVREMNGVLGSDAIIDKSKITIGK